MERTVAESRDKFSISHFVWIALLCLLFASSNDLDRIFNLYLALVPLLLLPALAITIYWSVALIRNIVLRRWRRVASVLTAPVMAYIIFAGAGAAGIDSKWIRFEIGKHYYLDQIVKLPVTGEPRFKMFDWRQTGGVAVTNFIYTLIFDESDEIALAPDERSKEWQQRAGKMCPGTIMCVVVNPREGMSVTVRRIEGHFYLVTEIFGD
jgi:hypothetical protein